MSPQAFIFIGRPGAGKGTQAKLLMEALQKSVDKSKLLYIETGAELRKFSNENGYIPSLTKKAIDAGNLVPEFVTVYMWARLLSESSTEGDSIVFDGTPRKLMEAKVLDSVFPFLNIVSPTVIHLEICPDTVENRLLLRAKKEGRADDDASGIKRRLEAFEDEVRPVVEYYRTHPGVKFVDIDGKKSIEDVHAEIMAKSGQA